mmetsp:Transcript_35303/g.110000  ORF Transcript_35303/g.110000 Transcript_35303/m.110000 type:complete len:291 (-) Transcript_35303:536-1408(-)
MAHVRVDPDDKVLGKTGIVELVAVELPSDAPESRIEHRLEYLAGALALEHHGRPSPSFVLVPAPVPVLVELVEDLRGHPLHVPAPTAEDPGVVPEDVGRAEAVVRPAPRVRVDCDPILRRRPAPQRLLVRRVAPHGRVAHGLLAGDADAGHLAVVRRLLFRKEAIPVLVERRKELPGHHRGALPRVGHGLLRQEVENPVQGPLYGLVPHHADLGHLRPSPQLRARCRCVEGLAELQVVDAVNHPGAESRAHGHVQQAVPRLVDHAGHHDHGHPRRPGGRQRAGPAVDHQG